MHDLYIHVTKQLGIEQYQHFTVKIKFSKTRIHKAIIHTDIFRAQYR